MTTERIAAAIKPILDEDRRADRVRIAELERDNAALRASTDEVLEGVKKAIEKGTKRKEDSEALIDDLNKQLDVLTEKCAALVVERDRLIGEQMNDGWPCRSPTAVATPGSPEAPTLRIDTDMSDPQPGKLLVVRIDDDTANRLVHQSQTITSWTSECVGFLVETPAVEVKEQGPWVVYDVDEPNWRMRDAWVYAVSGEGFDSKEEAQKIIDDFGRGSKKMRVITLAEARAIEGKR